MVSRAGKFIFSYSQTAKVQNPYYGRVCTLYIVEVDFVISGLFRT